MSKTRNVKKNYFIGARIDLATIESVDRIAGEYNTTTSEIIRGLLAHCDDLYPFVAKYDLRAIELEEDLIEEVINMLPEKYANPAMALVISRIIRKVSDRLGEGGQES